MTDVSGDFLSTADPDREAVTGFGFERLPGLAYVRSDCFVQVVNGWEPEGWRAVTNLLSNVLSWSRPNIPRPGDPTPYLGTPVKGV